MKYNQSNKTKEINQYFKKFILSHTDYFHSDELDTKIRKKLEKLSNVPFDSDWNYLMYLVQLIENMYSPFGVDGFVSKDNYFRFEFGDGERIQDKGITKMDAIYKCCYRALSAYWKGEVSPSFKLGGEPFDLDDDL